MFQLISNRGNIDALYTLPNSTAVQTKLSGPIATWGGLDNASTIDPAVATSYDMTDRPGFVPRVHEDRGHGRWELGRGRRLAEDSRRKCRIRGGDGGERPVSVHDRGALPKHDERHRTLETFHPVPILSRITMRRSLPLLRHPGPGLRMLRRSEGADARILLRQGSVVSPTSQPGGGSPVGAEAVQRAPGTAVANSSPGDPGDMVCRRGWPAREHPWGGSGRNTTPTGIPCNSKSRGRRAASRRAPGTA